jgi:hypothetical protein
MRTAGESLHDAKNLSGVVAASKRRKHSSGDKSVTNSALKAGISIAESRN